jgi:hypothetical protein
LVINSLHPLPLGSQADLIKKFVESPKPETVRTNLSFLVDAGLLPDYADKIRSYLEKNPNSAATSSPAGLQSVHTADDAIDLVMSLEGGYSDDQNGGVTNFGISQGEAERYYHRPVSKDQLRNLTRTDAREIYRKLYLRYADGIESVKVKATYLGMAASIGFEDTISILQRTVAKISKAQLDSDGIFSAANVALINSLDPDLLIETMDCAWVHLGKPCPKVPADRSKGDMSGDITSNDCRSALTITPRRRWTKKLIGSR